MEADQRSEHIVANMSQNSPKKKVNIWMIISIVLIIILVGLGAYEVGKYQMISSKAPVLQQNTMQNIISPTITQVLPSSTISPTSATGKKVSAGIKSQVFSPYTVTVPSGWVDTHTTSTTGDTLTITNGQYVFTISQAAGGAGSCNFPGDTPEPMAQVFTNFVGITGSFVQFRRGTMDNTTYTICEQKNNQFVFPTSIGYITYKTPAQTDSSLLSQMDSMVASLTK